MVITELSCGCVIVAKSSPEDPEIILSDCKRKIYDPPVTLEETSRKFSSSEHARKMIVSGKERTRYLTEITNLIRDGYKYREMRSLLK